MEFSDVSYAFYTLQHSHSLFCRDHNIFYHSRNTFCHNHSHNIFYHSRNTSYNTFFLTV